MNAADPNAELKLALAAIRNTSTKTSDETTAKTSKNTFTKTSDETAAKTPDIVNASASESIEIANASDCKSMTPPSLLMQPPTPMHHKQLNLIKQCFATKYGDSGSDIVQDSKFAYACIPIATQVTTETNEIKNRAAAKTSTKKKKKGEGAILKRKMNREALFGMDDSNLHATKFEIGMQDASTQTWIGLE